MTSENISRKIELTEKDIEEIVYLISDRIRGLKFAIKHVPDDAEFIKKCKKDIRQLEEIKDKFNY